MGCDIHVVLERRWKEQWVGLDHHGAHACERNYERFTKLCGVRAELGEDYPEPRGLPDDASPLSQMQFEGWGMDAHSASWHPLQDFVRICLETEFDPENAFLNDKDPRKEPYYYYFGLYADEGDFDLNEYRVVFWFDN
jgi:hypothetical protein